VLTIARVKVSQAGVDIQWKKGLAYHPPYPDNSFDVLVSSKEFAMMMGFGILMMLLVIGVPLVGITVLIVWLVNRSKK
jgi:hypothetical protein